MTTIGDANDDGSRVVAIATVLAAACASEGSDNIYYSGDWDQVSVSFTCASR